MRSLCRNCELMFEGEGICPECRSPRIVSHPELSLLHIAHIDCDAFFASVEKRNNPDLINKPVIIGGGHRGVVSTACYIARIKGVHSAMPMYQAMQLCPEAVVVRPRMGVYSAVSKEIVKLMKELTPRVETISVDEAFLDFSGTTLLHKTSPAQLVVKLVNRIERQVGITCSVGLSINKFLAKIASDLEKPKGFSLIGQGDIKKVLGNKPLTIIPGVGKSFQKKLEKEGLFTFFDLQKVPKEELEEKFGKFGNRLWHLSRGEDNRTTKVTRPIKSISNETTFNTDISDYKKLEGYAWRLTEKVTDRAKEKGLVGNTVTLKLKQHNHKIHTRQERLKIPTNLASQIFPVARSLLKPMVKDFAPFRLLGIGLSGLENESRNTNQSFELNPELASQKRVENVSDELRRKFGPNALRKGISLN
ncbi:MAG: DNA polymerase IV [Paracoccaceae bacterium]|nr:DNA polymerase IV [Paracoccaceae bacterium]MDE2675475.1 DNA polymerase IV [Paracoccaceae bacterium]